MTDEQLRKLNEEQEKKDQVRREQEQKHNDCVASCSGDCDNKVNVPCVQSCVFKDGKQVSDIDTCKQTCEGKNKDAYNSCNSECTTSCDNGNNVNFGQNKDTKIMKTEFSLQGSCMIYSKQTKFQQDNGYIRIQPNGPGFDEFINI